MRRKNQKLAQNRKHEVAEKRKKTEDKPERTEIDSRYNEAEMRRESVTE